MRNDHVFRPLLNESTLEARMVLSTAPPMPIQLNLPTAARLLTEPIHQGLPHPQIRIHVTQRYAHLIQKYFANFTNMYFFDINNVLFAANPTTSTAISTNRTSFDTRVQNQVQILDLSIANVLSLANPSVFNLVPAIQQTLQSNSSSSMLSQLKALTTPTATTGSTVDTFEAQSRAIIAETYNIVIAQLNQFLQNPAATFPALVP